MPRATSRATLSTHATAGHEVSNLLAIEGHLDEPLSRWPWLVAWLLAVPHIVVLVFLWLAFAVLTLITFVARLFTGRHPQGMFEFNVGVLRWTWRVNYYALDPAIRDRSRVCGWPRRGAANPDRPAATLSAATCHPRSAESRAV